jgi:hypothetical protein
MKIVFFVILFLVIFSAGSLRSQCSDAGIGSLDNHTERWYPLYAALTYDYGYSGKQDNIFVNDLLLEASRRVGPKLEISVRIPFEKKIFNTNDLYSGSIQGIGDLIFSANYELYTRNPKRIGWSDYWGEWNPHNEHSMMRSPRTILSLDMGAKLSTGAVNRDQVPLRYQPGSGSDDLLVGLSFIPGPDSNMGEYDPQFWQFRAGFQLPVFRTYNWVDSVKRGADLVGRITYNNAMEDLDYQAELIAIKRLSKSFSGETEIPNSDFFQIDLKLSATLYLVRNAGLQLGAAIPFIQRKENYDGLERSYTIFCGINYLYARL